LVFQKYKKAICFGKINQSMTHQGFINILKHRWFRVLAGTLTAFFVLNICFPLKVQTHYSTIVLDSNDRLIHAFLNDQDRWRMPTELTEISPMLEKALIHKEDRFFYYHLGFNPLAMLRAGVRNVFMGRRTSGASTITMQVARLLYPKKRTYLNKIVEVFRAVQLELKFSKKEILQLYINLIPYGSNIEGMKSASVLYFQKSPKVLSLAETVTLAIIPNRPSSLQLGENNAYILQERNRWLQKFGEERVFDQNLITDALAEPLNAKRHAAPRDAPHLAIRLSKMYPNEAIIRTAIVLNKQRQTENLVKNYVARLYALNIHNAAVMVLNNQTHEVEAYVGSADFKNPTDGGQVDGVRAIRSPGSTLKPLLYGVAFDKGIITPKSIINDVPTNFGGFEPENFDQLFHGKVSIEYALANSLNIPAVKILKEISTPVLVDKLKKANFGTVKKEAKSLGLSLVLGGCSVTLEELTTLFSALANRGTFASSNLLKNNDLDAKKDIIGEALLSEESTFLVNQILSQITRPDLPNNYDYTYRMPKIAWKTGTSFGKKDAWSIGYNARYTIGVWVGNFSGEGVPELSGANIATPLLFDIFNTLDYNSVAQWFAQPKGLALRKICAETGDIPNEFCEHQLLDLHIPGVSKMTRCGHLKPVWVNQKASVSYCTQCMPDSGAVQKHYPNHNPELIAWFESKHVLYQKIPVHNPDCKRIFGGNAPQIIFPTNGNEYFLEQKSEQKLMLSCQANNDAKEVYWYVNDKLLGRSEANKPMFFKPPLGKIKISCSDDQGRSTHIVVKVRI
jgi:penicillin-binding protein 1C